MISNIDVTCDVLAERIVTSRLRQRGDVTVTSATFSVHISSQQLFSTDRNIETWNYLMIYIYSEQNYKLFFYKL